MSGSTPRRAALPRWCSQAAVPAWQAPQVKELILIALHDRLSGPDKLTQGTLQAFVHHGRQQRPWQAVHAAVTFPAVLGTKLGYLHTMQPVHCKQEGSRAGMTSYLDSICSSVASCLAPHELEPAQA